jgi:hypothetical protein
MKKLNNLSVAAAVPAAQATRLPLQKNLILIQA